MAGCLFLVLAVLAFAWFGTKGLLWLVAGFAAWLLLWFIAAHVLVWFVDRED